MKRAARIFFTLLSCIGCRPSAELTSDTKTIVSEAEVSRRFDLFSRKISVEKLCDDYRVALDLFQSLAPQVNLPYECPQSAIEFTNRLQQAVIATKDFHAEVEFPYQLSAVTPAVVSACGGWADCEAAIGSYFYPVQTSFAAGAVYGYLKTDTHLIPTKVLKINQHTVTVRLEEIIGSNLYGHSSASNVAALSRDLLTRSAIDKRSKEKNILLLEDLTNNQVHEIETSYDPPRRKGFDLAWETEYLQADLHRFYPCFDERKHTFAFGSCQANNEAFVWGGAWTEELDKHLTQIRSEAPKMVTFDMRSNGGGDPSLVAKFACTFGDEAILARMQNIGYRVARLPKSVAGVMMDSLLPHDNEDLYSFVGPEYQDLPFLGRLGITEDSCRAMRSPALADTEWVILTNGSEFSAAEIFLEIISASSRFKIVGARTRGGSGSPVWFTLPHTGVQLRLSIARLVDFTSGITLIEGRGVEPDITTSFFGSFEFERRLKGLSDKSGSCQLMSMLNFIQTSF